MNILQQNKTKKFFISFLIQALFIVPVFGIDLDYTVDDAIRKNYGVGSNGINNAKPAVKPVQKTTPAPAKPKTTESMPKLPALPKNKQPVTKQTTSVTKKTTPVKKVVIKKTAASKSFPMRKGMSFEIVNTNAISDKQRTGTRIVFTTRKPIKTAYYTIPQGTKLTGEIAESHTPQISGNGGLVSLSIDTIILGGKYQHIETRVLRVGGKKVFLKDIKGKRSYWKNTVNKGKWGRRTFHKMNKLSANLVQDKTTVILAPFTFVYGVVLGTVSTVTSPVVSIFCKGGSVYIPVNTPFKIKLTEDVKLYY